MPARSAWWSSSPLPLPPPANPAGTPANPFHSIRLAAQVLAAAEAKLRPALQLQLTALVAQHAQQAPPHHKVAEGAVRSKTSKAAAAAGADGGTSALRDVPRVLQQVEFKAQVDRLQVARTRCASCCASCAWLLADPHPCQIDNAQCDPVCSQLDRQQPQCKPRSQPPPPPLCPLSPPRPRASTHHVCVRSCTTWHPC